MRRCAPTVIRIQAGNDLMMQILPRDIKKIVNGEGKSAPSSHAMNREKKKRKKKEKIEADNSK